MTASNPIFNQYRNKLPASAIIPIVAYLCHESCKENGGIF